MNNNGISLTNDNKLEVEIISEPIKDLYEFDLISGINLKVSANYGTVVGGGYVNTNGEGRIFFSVISDNKFGQSTIRVESLDGDAVGEITINFIPIN